jgi:hypothetical protein
VHDDPAVRAGVGLLSHHSLLYASLTARENVAFAARLYGVPDPEAAAMAALERLRVADRADTPVRRLSRGLQQRVSAARAVVHGPRCCCSTSPTPGSTPSAPRRCPSHAHRARRARRGARARHAPPRRGARASPRRWPCCAPGGWPSTRRAPRWRPRRSRDEYRALVAGGAMPPDVEWVRLTPTAPGLLATAWLVARKDLLIEFRTRSAFLAAVVFALLGAVIFRFAWDPTAVAALDLAPGVLWVIFVFSGLLGLHRSFGVEQADRAVDGLLAAPVAREALFLGKALANLAFVSAVQLVAIPAWRSSTTCPVGGGVLEGSCWRRSRRGARGRGHAVQRDDGEHAPRRAAAADAGAAVLRAGGDAGGAGHGAPARRPAAGGGGADCSDCWGASTWSSWSPARSPSRSRSRSDRGTAAVPPAGVRRTYPMTIPPSRRPPASAPHRPPRRAARGAPLALPGRPASTGCWRGLLALVGVLVRAVWFTPVEAMQGPAQKIFYAHVPSVIVGLYLALPLVAIAAACTSGSRTSASTASPRARPRSGSCS